jgi:hypothetical protein
MVFYNLIIYMLKQIFKENIPIENLFVWLDMFCVKNDKFYLIDHNAYKKALFHAHEKDFLEECKPFYHKSKDFYVTRKFTYNSFVNIVRQICKSNNIMFTNQIKYNESKYNIQYYIYYNQ